MVFLVQHSHFVLLSLYCSSASRQCPNSKPFLELQLELWLNFRICICSDRTLWISSFFMPLFQWAWLRCVLALMQFCYVLHMVSYPRNRAFCAAWHGSHQNRLGMYSPLHKHSKEWSQLAPVAVLRRENRCIAPQLYTTIQGRRTGCPPTSDGGVLQAATSVCRTVPNLQGSQIHPTIHTNGQVTVNKFQSTTMNYKITQKHWLKKTIIYVLPRAPLTVKHKTLCDFVSSSYNTGVLHQLKATDVL